MGSTVWLVPILGVVVLMAVVAIAVMIRSWPPRPDVTREERAEMASAPMPRLQISAWWGIGISFATIATIATILVNRGAAAYWENDGLRMLVVMIFLGGLFAYVGVVLDALAREELEGDLDERDQIILRRAPTAQFAAVLVTVAAWVATLPKMFHDEGAVPVVYLYLMFGSVVIISMWAQSMGILVGYWISARRG